ncbi:SDR family NAD(P)-dependent oxidoreductase [Streptomyces sp. PsTaAH-124]|uniref:SDR family NAD(P)-dependent oxidoreductase n=1 Tax=Streptomyces sp. PsTaAH-124 TaxID=1157638 RepID=UPI00036F84FE|nr:SDR family NAD(P)-dependent oxidoreductase [Streptomyces sp. PsTaAH-124]
MTAPSGSSTPSASSSASRSAAAPPWDVTRPPRADGRVFLVTGGNAGIGYFVVEQLAASGAEVVLGSRDPARAQAAMASVRGRVPGARVRAVRMDLADPLSLPAAVAELRTERLDAAVLNAGIALDHPPRRESTDGNELMFATNHLGHFALTAHLMPLLAAAPAARVVTMGSIAARSERLDAADPQSAHDYRPKRAYGRSKLAQMSFALELDRRLRAAGSPVSSLIAHPGGALDSLTPSRPLVHTRSAGARLLGLPAGAVLQGKDAGAWPAVRAVLDPAAHGGEIWGPRVLGLRGRPRSEPVWPLLTGHTDAAWLWELSAALTGVTPV